jgi:hypothetical protein
MSGRALRRLPVLALARYIGIGISSGPKSGPGVNPPTEGAVDRSGMRQSNQGGRGGHEGGGTGVDLWLEGMEKVIVDWAREHEKLL